MEAHRIVVKVPRQEIFYVTGLIESYSRIAVTRTLDRWISTLEILASPYCIEDIHNLINALKEEIPIEIISEDEMFPCMS